MTKKIIKSLLHHHDNSEEEKMEDILKTVKKTEVELGPKEWVDLENLKM